MKIYINSKNLVQDIYEINQEFNQIDNVVVDDDNLMYEYFQLLPKADYLTGNGVLTHSHMLIGDIDYDETDCE